MEKIKDIWFENGRIWMRSHQGQVYSRPLEAFPALKEATEEQRKRFLIWDEDESVRWPEIDEDIHISSFFETEEPNPDNPVARMLNCIPALDIREFAQQLGMNWTKLARLRSGIWEAGPQTLATLRQAMLTISRDILQEVV